MPFDACLARNRDKSVLYPVMHWCLERLPQLKKRAYLARYLMPVEVPAEFMQDQALLDLSESYKEMQASPCRGTRKCPSASEARPYRSTMLDVGHVWSSERGFLV